MVAAIFLIFLGALLALSGRLVWLYLSDNYGPESRRASLRAEEQRAEHRLEIMTHDAMRHMLNVARRDL
jgi:hypothetical protein